MKVCSYVKDHDGCSYHRVLLPNQNIKAEVREVVNLTEDDVAWCDILHYSRHTKLSPRFLDDMRKKYGFKIVVDTDDWWEVGKDHPKYDWWRRSNVGLQIREHLMNADAVTCTTEKLKERVLPLNNNVFVIPNYLPYGKGQFKAKKPTSSERVRLLYASTLMNYTNTSIISGAMKKLAHLPIEVVIAGYYKDNPLFDIVVKNLTDNSIPYTLVDWLPSDKYMNAYDADIMLLPSKDTEFNSLKSNIKLLEAGARKMPVVVSNVDLYKGFPVHYCNGENDWVDAITGLVNNPELRKTCGEELYKFCKSNYDLVAHSDERLKIYESI